MSKLTYIIGALTLFLTLGFLGGCAVFRDDLVLTTKSQVKPDRLTETKEIPLVEVPEKYRNQFVGKTVVLAPKDALKPEGVGVPLGSDWSGNFWGTLLGTVLGLGKAVLPGLAAWEGLLTLFFRRKRQHYASAVKAVLPGNGKVEAMEAFSSLAKALGATHSSAASETAFVNRN